MALFVTCQSVKLVTHHLKHIRTDASWLPAGYRRQEAFVRCFKVGVTPRPRTWYQRLFARCIAKSATSDLNYLNSLARNLDSPTNASAESAAVWKSGSDTSQVLQFGSKVHIASSLVSQVAAALPWCNARNRKILPLSDLQPNPNFCLPCNTIKVEDVRSLSRYDVFETCYTQQIGLRRLLHSIPLKASEDK
jgi:hypothetical protein